MYKSLALVFIFQFALCLPALKCQQLDLFLNSEYASYTDKALNNPAKGLHTGFKPLMESQIDKVVSYDTVMGYSAPSPKRSWLYRKIYRENLFIINDSISSNKKFHCEIDPLFDFEGAVELANKNKKYYENTRGILIQGDIGKNFSFSTSFFENQEDFAPYINEFIQTNGVVPGQGRVKSLSISSGGSFYSQGYDFSMPQGYICWSPAEFINLQFGEGKNFIGDGYRSLLLSDNSFVYPYLRITTTLGHFQYTNLYAVFSNPFSTQEIFNGNETLFPRKAASIQYLSWNITPALEWGIFQALIWQAADSDNRGENLNLYYFNPVLGVSAVRYGLGNNNNVLCGSTLKYKVSKSFMLYGQLLVDDFPQNGNLKSMYDKTGFQGGFKFYSGKVEWMEEYNQVRPYTYSADNPSQSYTNYDQALADPLGANFREFISKINCRILPRLAFSFQVNYALIGESINGENEGTNIEISDVSAPDLNYNTTGQLVTSHLSYLDTHISYLLNPHTNMNLSLGLTNRGMTGSPTPVSTMVYLAFRTSLLNKYYDF